MNKRKILLPTFLSIAFLALFLISTKSAFAFSFQDIVTGAKSFITGDNKKENGELALQSDIKLAPGGDVEENGQIDSGDILRFTYTFTNTSNKDYSFAKLSTNVNRKQLNFIHNVKGMTGFIDDGKTITVPNLRFQPSQSFTISFDARINFDKDKDQIISTEGELISKDNKQLVKSVRKEVKAGKINAEKIKTNNKFQRKESNE